jgi:hypothetical protein
MRRSKELIVLVVLLLGTVAFVMWYVVDRRARQRNAPPAEKPTVGPVAPSRADPPPGTSRTTAPAPAGQEIDLDRAKGKTLDLSHGRPVIKDSPEDRAAMDAALKEMEEAAKEVTFDAPKASDPKK